MKRADLPTFSDLRVGAEFYVPAGNRAVVSPKTPKDGPFTKYTRTTAIGSPTAANRAGGKEHRVAADVRVWPAGTRREVDEIQKHRSS